MKQSLEKNLKEVASDLVSAETCSLPLNHFSGQGLPTRREENWKYTDLSFLEKSTFKLSKQITLNSLNNGFQGNAHKLVFVDGHFSAPLSSIDALASQCTVLSLKQALADDPETIKKYLEDVQAKDVRFLNLNKAFVSNGYVIIVPKGVVIEKPLHLLFVSSDANNVMSFSRNIIVLKENSHLTVFEEHIPIQASPLQAQGASLEGQSTFNNHITQVILEQGAKLNRYKLQNQNQTAIHIAQTLVNQKCDAQFNSYQVTLGAALSRDDLNISQQAKGASCTLYGLYLGEAKQHQDHHTRIDHLAPHGTSVEYYKGVLTGEAKGVFNGKVIVHPDAQKINSRQTNKNLLLSKTAEVDTKPELEIYADDVACAHGATIGQIDPESLFYLRSRGLDSASAMSLLMHAFADEILEKFVDKEIADYLQEAVHIKMSAHFVPREN
jgi:Fe-S cluster assembly protein SufD